jgi:geranylgeranyl pyrophosphate synthase
VLSVVKIQTAVPPTPFHGQTTQKSHIGSQFTDFSPCLVLSRAQVVELLSTVIEHLVKGEIMQMKPSTSGRSALDYYLRKNFYKTASLMGHSCLAAAVLGECRIP